MFSNINVLQTLESILYNLQVLHLLTKRLFAPDKQCMPHLKNNVEYV